MSDPAVLEISLDPELHAALLAAAETARRPVAEIINDLIRDYVVVEPEEPGYEAFLRQKIETARESVRLGQGRSNEEVEAFFSALRRELLTQIP